jgi:hypothetical protein
LDDGGMGFCGRALEPLTVQRTGYTGCCHTIHLDFVVCLWLHGLKQKSHPMIWANNGSVGCTLLEASTNQLGWVERSHPKPIPTEYGSLMGFAWTRCVSLRKITLWNKLMYLQP